MEPIFQRAAGYQGDALNLPVRSVAEALPFYEQRLGFHVVERRTTPVDAAILERDGVRIGLTENGGDPTQDGSFFEVSSIDAAFQELKGRGLELRAPELKSVGQQQYRAFFVIAPDGLCYMLGEAVPAARKDAPTPPAEVQQYYARFPEESRLATGPSRLEFERTKEVLTRVLPPPPCRVLDVGGAAGAYSLWLAGQGYEVHLVDAAPRLVEEARKQSSRAGKPLASIQVGDARQLPHPTGFAPAVLVMGPLYHLPEAGDRRLALREAARVLTAGGVLVAAAISRYASTLNGLARGLSKDPAFRAIRDRDLLEGQHRNPTDQLDYFTTAYLHRPEELVQELESAGFTEVVALGVEGPGWLLADFDARWDDAASRRDLLEVARALEAEGSIIGASAHLLGIGTKRAGG